MSKHPKTTIRTLIAQIRLIDAQLRYEGTLTDDEDKFDEMVDKAVAEERKLYKLICKETPADKCEVRLMLGLALDFMKHSIPECQSARKSDPRSASNFDPL